MTKRLRTLLSRLRDSAVTLRPIHSKLDHLHVKVDALADTECSSSSDACRDSIVQISNCIPTQSAKPVEDIASTSESAPQVQVQEPPSAEVASESSPLITLRPGDALRMVFVIQHCSIWPSWRSVWQAAQNNPRFDVKVVLAPFMHPLSSTAVDYDDTKALLLREHIPFLHADFIEIGSFRPHVVFVQNPYEETRPQDLSTDQLRRQGIRVAYIPYGLEMGGGAWNFKAQFDSALHRTAWKIFARSERSRTMFGKYCSSGNHHVVVTGHPKFDAPRTSDIGPAPRLVSMIANRKVVLWTPHFSVSEQPTWSSYKIFADVIFNEFRRRKNVFLLIRPHPLFLRAMHHHGVWDAYGEQNFRKDIEESENMALDESSDYAESFSIADALMADVGSFLLEFLPTGKPIMYLHCERGLGMNDDGALVRSLYTAFTESDISEFLEMVERGQDPMKAQRALATNEFLFGLELNSTAGERICEYIFSAISRGDSWSPHNANRKHSTRSKTTVGKFNKLGSEEFNAKLDAALAEVAAMLPDIDNAIDINCGDGHFTFRLAAHVRRMIACDESQFLLGKVMHIAAEFVNEKVLFVHRDRDAPTSLEKFDLSSCVNIFSSLDNDAAFLHFLDHLMMLSRQSGHLLVVDTFVVNASLYSSQAEDVGVKYRSIRDCAILLERRGFQLVQEHPIEESIHRGLSVILLLFTFNDPLLPSQATRIHT